MIGAQSVIAQTVSSTVSTDPGQLSQLPHSQRPQAAYQSGFQHGVTDGNTSSNATSYIDQPKHGFAWHSAEFVEGYVNGYCSIPANKNVGTDDDRAAFYCPDGPSSAKWFIGKHEPITEGIAVVTYGIPSAGVNVTYQYYDKTSGSGGSETRMVNKTGEMHFLGYTDELVGYYPGDKVTVNVSQCITHLNAYSYPECISQPILDNKTITLGETGGIVSLDLSKSAIPLVTSVGLPKVNDSAFWTPKLGSQSEAYWTLAEGPAPPNMNKYHIFLDGFDPKNNVTKNLSLCLVYNITGPSSCHELTNLPSAPNSSIDAGYFVTSLNGSLWRVLAEVKYQDIGVGPAYGLNGTEWHMNMHQLYSEIAGTKACIEDYHFVQGTEKYNECIDTFS
jgi:hypothetical protein